MFLADYAVYLHPKLLIVKVISFSLPKRKDLINVTHCISYFCKATRLSNHRSQKHLQSTDIILEVVQSIIPCNLIIIIIDVGLGTQHARLHHRSFIATAAAAGRRGTRRAWPRRRRAGVWSRIRSWRRCTRLEEEERCNIVACVVSRIDNIFIDYLLTLLTQ